MTTKTALITGTSRPVGLGFAVARQLAELGYHVVLAARDVSGAEPLAEQLRQDGHAATALRLDLTDRADIHEGAEYLTWTFGNLDVLINNASDMPDFEIVSALDADLGAVRSAMEVDVIGPWGLVQSMLPLLTAAPAARIVNVSSLSALQIAIVLDLGASLRAPAYSMAKHMLNALTSVLARDFKDTPILVNAVDPGETATHPERGDDDNDRPAAESARGVVWAATLGSGVAASGAATMGGREIRQRTQAEVNEALALLQIGKPAGTGAVVAVSTLEPMEGRREDLVEVLTELAPQIRAEPGVHALLGTPPTRRCRRTASRHPDVHLDRGVQRPQRGRGGPDSQDRCPPCRASRATDSVRTGLAVRWRGGEDRPAWDWRARMLRCRPLLSEGGSGVTMCGRRGRIGPSSTGCGGQPCASLSVVVERLRDDRGRGPGWRPGTARRPGRTAA
ncbi:SDR family NAD(P)-dependent oxidoreductase [Streptomyces sp. NPDC002521]